jgi:hypothetical protein
MKQGIKNILCGMVTVATIALASCNNQTNKYDTEINGSNFQFQFNEGKNKTININYWSKKDTIEYTIDYSPIKTTIEKRTKYKTIILEDKKEQYTVTVLDINGNYELEGMQKAIKNNLLICEVQILMDQITKKKIQYQYLDQA